MLAPNVLLSQPNIRIFGLIGNGTFWDVVNQLQQIRAGPDDLVLELSTEGGDADTARRIALEISLFIRDSGRQAYFVGKSFVYSAGITIMGAFPISNRALTYDTTLLVHERRTKQTIQLDGPMQANIQIIREHLAVLETAQRIEEQGFKNLIEGSNIDLPTVHQRARGNYYMTAQEALELGIIGSIL
jgi:ATP-dependent protease ClpP protease subunit